MENKYLNENKYQKINKNVNKFGLILLIIGLIMEIGSIIFTIIFFINFENKNTSNLIISFAIVAVILLLGYAITRFGGQMFYIGHKREIVAYKTQQIMPVAKEGINEMAPTIGSASGTIAKEVAAGIKEGLSSDNTNNSEENKQ